MDGAVSRRLFSQFYQIDDEEMEERVDDEAKRRPMKKWRREWTMIKWSKKQTMMRWTITINGPGARHSIQKRQEEVLQLQIW